MDVQGIQNDTDTVCSLLVVVGPNWPRSKLMKPDTSRMNWVNKGIIIDIFCIISISHSRLRQGEDDLSGFCGGLAKVTRDAGCWNMKSLLDLVNAYGYIWMIMGWRYMHLVHQDVQSKIQHLNNAIHVYPWCKAPDGRSFFAVYLQSALEVWLPVKQMVFLCENFVVDPYNFNTCQVGMYDDDN